MVQMAAELSAFPIRITLLEKEQRVFMLVIARFRMGRQKISLMTQRAISMSSVMTTAVVVPVEMPEAAGMIPARSTALRSEKGPIIQTLQLWKWRDTP